MRSLEREVLGCDFGGTSWTTRSQADLIPSMLELVAGKHLLEIGAGTGWPGLYLASETGCDVTLLDLPFSTLEHASQRARDDSVEDLCRFVSASGAALPFVSSSFTAISHSDVLCCLPQKLEMLRECRRVAGTGALMLFYVIAPTRGLDKADLEQACEAGPPYVGVEQDYLELLRASQWDILDRADLTREYLAALQKLVSGLEKGVDELQRVLGTNEYVNQLKQRRTQIEAVEAGILEREMYLVHAV
jgi:cyclopropane fatty-acyl-phospholipid synthase-like methyltransferase